LRYSLVLLISVAACAGPRYSTLQRLGSSFSSASADSLGALRIDIQGLDRKTATNAQIMLIRAGSDSVPGRYFTYRAFAPIDSLVPGVYTVRVQLVGYTPPRLEVTIRPGEVVSLVAVLRRSRLRLRSVTS